MKIANTEWGGPFQVEERRIQRNRDGSTDIVVVKDSATSFLVEVNCTVISGMSDADVEKLIAQIGVAIRNSREVAGNHGPVA